MKIGIMGGTFNPPHKGHKNIILEAYDKLKLDKIYVIPNNIPSHKKMPLDSPSPQNRLDMCKIMCKDLTFTKVLDIEIKKGGKSYTIDTLREFTSDKLYLIIGSDSFLSIETWKEFKEIFRLCELVVFKRDLNIDLKDYKEYLEQTYKIKVHLMEHDVLEISSTEIRENNEFDIVKMNEYINSWCEE